MQSNNMTVITIEGGIGPAEALTVQTAPKPQVGHGQILISVAAAGVNRPDLAQRAGLYPPPAGASKILGLEVAGTVVALGPGAERWTLGDKVTALLPGGGYAQYALVDSRHALPIPTGMSEIEAAGLPETIFTVYANVFELGALKSGETLLVHGATSGIGVAAIQMAKAAGARVIATSRGADKSMQALQLGADISIDVANENFAEVAKANGGVDVVLDMVAGPYFPMNLDAMRPGGRLVHIAFLGGMTVELVLPIILLKRLTISGSTLRARDADEKARLAAAVETTVWPWIAEGKVRSVIDRVFPLEQAAEAHSYIEAGAHVGKIILTPTASQGSHSW